MATLHPAAIGAEGQTYEGVATRNHVTGLHVVSGDGAEVYYDANTGGFSSNMGIPDLTFAFKLSEFPGYEVSLLKVTYDSDEDGPHVDAVYADENGYFNITIFAYMETGHYLYVVLTPSEQQPPQQSSVRLAGVAGVATAVLFWSAVNLCIKRSRRA